MSPGAAPRQQEHWDWRAAGNFMCGGAGTGLAAFAAAAAVAGASFVIPGLAALALIAAGLFFVWLEIGRPWRFINVVINPHTSWMTREALTSGPLFAAGLAAVWFDSAVLAAVTAALALVFLYCQARMIHASKGIPTWREDRVVPLLVTTGLAEGGGAFLAGTAALADPFGVGLAAALAVLALVALRWWFWVRYFANLRHGGAPAGALDVLQSLQAPFILASHIGPILLIAGGLAFPPLLTPGFVLGGLLAMAGGWAFKFTLITRAGFNQGFAIRHTPARGAGPGGPGVKPGWSAR
ncbi:MAG: polysulfide reductase NrfD [Rhodospirillales bacterium]|nr:polysulfide reductase NrfD [Rhodospirillales bacterium]